MILKVIMANPDIISIRKWALIVSVVFSSTWKSHNQTMQNTSLHYVIFVLKFLWPLRCAIKPLQQEISFSTDDLTSFLTLLNCGSHTRAKHGKVHEISVRCKGRYKGVAISLASICKAYDRVEYYSLECNPVWNGLIKWEYWHTCWSQIVIPAFHGSFFASLLGLSVLPNAGSK